jgi:hypothetical protein
MQGDMESTLSTIFNSLIYRNAPALAYISTRSAVREIFGRMNDANHLSKGPLERRNTSDKHPLRHLYYSWAGRQQQAQRRRGGWR